MANEKAYHIMLNGKGYVLLDESYAVQPQRAFNPRFSTGDPSMGDLSFWQFMVQESFEGGCGQAIFDATNKYLEAPGWDLRDGKPRISYGRYLAYGATIPAAANQLTAQFFEDQFQGAVYGLVYEHTTGPQDGTITAYAPNVTVKSRSACRFIRSNAATVGGAGGHRGVAYIKEAANEAIAFRHSWNSADHTSLNLNANFTSGQVVAQVTSDLFVVGGCADSGTSLAIEFFPLAANAWTAGTQVYVKLNGLAILEANGGFINTTAMDSNGTLYLAATNIVEEAGSPTIFTTSTPRSTIFRITATDAVATNPRVSAVESSPYDIYALESLNGSVYMFGCDRVGYRKYQEVVVKYPNTVVWRSPRIMSAATTKQNAVIRSVFKMGDGLLFLANSLSDDFDSIYLLTLSDTIRECYAVHRSKTNSGETLVPWAIGEIGGTYHVYHRNTEVYRNNSVRGGLAFDAKLKLSAMGGNTPLIKKTLYSISIEISEVLPDGGRLNILINDQVVGNITASDGISKEITLEEEMSSASFSPTIIAPAGLTWSGYISKVTIRYIPTQFKKLAWGFAIRAHNNLKLLNGQFEKRDAMTLVEDLKDAWAANQPLDFTDVDGKKYKVIVTEFKGRQPLTADKRDDREYLIPIELLEV